MVPKLLSSVSMYRPPDKLIQLLKDGCDGGHGEFDEFLGLTGKSLLNYIQNTIERVGQNYIEGKPQDAKDQALFFYLWCGPKSPFFGKHAMKTFERYFLIDKQTHVERTLFWQQNLETDQFKKKL